MDRRTFVKTGVGAVVGVGGLSAAGWSYLPLVGSSGSVETYTKWLHEPGEVGERDHYSVTAMKPGTILSNEDVFYAESVSRFERTYDGLLDPTGVAASAIDRVVSSYGSHVYRGEFSTGDVETALEDISYSESGRVGVISGTMDADDPSIFP